MHIANVIFGVIALLVTGAVAFSISGAIYAFVRYRGKRVVECPETKKPVAVRVNALLAARDGMFGKPTIRLNQCTRWPERQNCGQECLSQIHRGPEDCLVRNMVNEWYMGKPCVYCGKSFDQIHWHDRQPALLAPNRVAIQWNSVPAEKLPEVFQSYQPVCWNCYIAETYRQQHPTEVVNRRWEREANGEYVPKEDAEETTGERVYKQ